MNLKKCAGNCGKYAWRNDDYCLTCSRAMLAKNKVEQETIHKNESVEGKSRQRVCMGKTNAAAERKVFWELMEKKLNQLGNPFTIKPSIANGQYRHWAHIYNTADVSMSTDFLVGKGILRIELYINNNLGLYQALKEHKANIEKWIGTSLIFTDGEKNPQVKWVKREWSLIPYDYNDYNRVLNEALPIMEKFVGILKGFVK